MLRGRGKDGRAKPAGARPDRKVTSRGMVYENEAMRFRTLEMATEVDRQHSDMRKLRRENDQLKQQLWTMRDEYQRLEEFVEELEEVALEDIEEEDDEEDGSGEADAAEGDVAAHLDLPAFDAEFALRGADAGAVGGGGDAAAGGASGFTVLVPDQPPIIIPDIPSSSPDGLPDPDEFFSPTKHFNLDQLMDIVHSFHAERDKHCVSATRRPSAAGPRAAAAAAADSSLGAGMQRRPEPPAPPGVVVTQSHVTRATAADGSRSVTFRRDSVVCVGEPGAAHSRCSSDATAPSSASDGSVARYVAQQATLVRINCVEPNTVMFSTRQHAALRGLTAPHVIDELERQFDSNLCEVRGVRVVADVAYVCLGSRASLLMLLGSGFTVRGVPVTLVDITHDSAVVMMAGVPHYISDGSIHILMDTFGTVIGEIERRFYKGVDTGDRFLRVKLRDGVRVPRYVTVGGNKITMRIVPPDEVGCALRPEQCQFASQSDSTQTLRSSDTRVGGADGGGFFAGSGCAAAAESAADAPATPVQSGGACGPVGKQGFTSHLQVQLRPRSAPETAPAARGSGGSSLSAPGDVPAASPAHLSMVVNTSDGPDSSPQPQPQPPPPPPPPPPAEDTPSKRRSRKPFLPRIRLPGAPAPAEPAAAGAASSSSELESLSKSSPDKVRRGGAPAGDASPGKPRRSLNSSPTKSVESRDSPSKQRGSVAFDESSGADSPPKRRQPRLQANGGILRRQVSEADSPQPSPDSLRRRALGDPVRARLAERIERRRARSLRRDSELSELSLALERRGSDGAGSASSRGTKAGSLPDSSDVPWCGCWGNGCF